MLVCEVGKTAIYTLTFTADGEKLLAGTKSGLIYEAASSGPAQLILDNNFFAIFEIYAVRSHPRHNHLLAIGAVGGWKTIDLETLDFHIEPSTEHCTAIEYYDERTLAIGSGNRAKDAPGSFELWDVAGEPRRREPHFKEPKGVRSLSMHRASGLVAWSSGARKVTVWDPRKQDPVSMALKQLATSLAFHPDGAVIAAAQDRGAVILDIAKKHEVMTITGHTGRVTSVAYRPDGRVLATGSWDGTVRLWEVSTGKLIAALSGPTGRVYTLAYDNDGLRLAAAGDAGNVVIWDAD